MGALKRYLEGKGPRPTWMRSDTSAKHIKPRKNCILYFLWYKV